MIAKRYCWIVAAIAGLHYAGPGRADENLYRKVVQATAYVSKSEGPQASGYGTGFLIDAKERLLVTARHVVETKTGLADAVVVVFAQTKDGEVITDSEYYRNNWNTLAIRGKIVYDSVRRDMAVLQLEKLPPDVKPLDLAEKKARPGQTIHVIGNSTAILGGMFNYCQGHVRNNFRYIRTGANVLATHAPTNRGDSGGPVVNNLGEVVGFCSLSTGAAPPKADPQGSDQLVDLSICVSEIRAGLQEMRGLVKGNDPVKPDAKAITFKGQAQSAVHAAKFDKDVTYRIVVVAQGFNPEMRVELPDDKGLTQNPFTNSAQGFGGKIQMLFTAKETAEHRIVIGYAPGADIAKGPFKYSLNIDKAGFEAEKAVNDPQLHLNEHIRKFEAGKIYDITVRGKGFEPDLRVVDGVKTIASQFNNGARAKNGDYETTLRFIAAKTADFRIHVSVSPFLLADTAARPYTLVVTEPKMELSVKDQLSVKDPLYPKGGPFKVHTVKLQADKTYQIDLVTTAFDSRLLLEDSTGKLLVQGFDADGFNARLIFRPAKTDTYRVVATAHQIDASGAYTLIAAENPNAARGFAPPPPDKKMPKNEPVK